MGMLSICNYSALIRKLRDRWRDQHLLETVYFSRRIGGVSYTRNPGLCSRGWGHFL